MRAAPAFRPRPGGRRRWTVAVALLLGGVVLVTGVRAQAAAPESGDDVLVTESALVVPVAPEPSGEQVTLDVSVFTADGAGERRPAVLLAHGFGGSKDQLAGQAHTLAARGYVVLTYTARGFGESGGLIHLNSPDYEIADATALIDLLATRDDVELDADGDPRVGVAGGSYGGAVALMIAGYDDRVDAIVPAITWNDLSQSLFPQYAQADGAPETGPATSQPVAEPGVFKQRWAALLFSSGLRGGDSRCGRFDPQVCALYVAAATTGRPGPQMLELLHRSSPAPVLGSISAPTLLLQGEQDSLFPLDQSDANARGIGAAGTPVAVTWIAGGHDATAGTATADDLTDAALSWFDHHLRGVGEDPGTPFTFALPTASLQDDDTPVRLRTSGYPGLAGSAAPAPRSLPLSGPEQQVVSPPGGEPSALTNLPGTGGALGAAAELIGGGDALGVLPGQSAIFTSAVVGEALTVVGSPRVRLSVSSTATDATLFVSAWVVTPSGSSTLPRQLVSPVRLDGLRPGVVREVDVSLPASAYPVEEGERLRVVVSSTDQAYAVPVDARLYEVSLAGEGSLVVPTVQADPVDDALSGSGVPLPLLVGVPALVLAALLWSLVTGRRHRQHPGVEAIREVPLAVESLVKSYASGLKAVDDVSWRAERGQVVGLLGPNGAGKTTTMRMLVGLIRPDGGSIHVLGQRVTAGAPVLARVGALIEGPGFLPHLSGRQNLHAYWEATGRPASEAGFDEALAIAGLGAAVERPVRSYSHGMRQRLGIAQAMLGLPDLLLLDEPTNGLDPPQIKAMRQVLMDYAAAGRTVVVSSHLLAEVEQTCSHVVVMHRGRVVMTGAVTDLVDTNGTAVVELDGGDPATAAALLRALDGVRTVDVDADGRLHVHGDAPRSLLVAELVGAGFAVSTVDGRRQLEEVFMQLVGDGQPLEEPMPS